MTKPTIQEKSESSQANSRAKSNNTTGPTALSQFQAKTVGHVEVYKSVDFKSSLNAIVAKGGSLSGIQTESLTGTNSDLLGASGGVNTGTGQLKTAEISTNQGSLVGANTGVLGQSKGAEGLS